VWVQAAVRAYLYTEWVAYAQVGIRPYLRGDLWGYYGNGCGDADGNGVTETVDALTFDLDWQVYLTASASAFGSSPTNWTLWGSPRYHIRFWDLIGSDALRPMINGPATVGVNYSQGYGGKMRPCWPYSDNVSYRFNWGDATSTNFSGAAHSWNTYNHTWNTTGAKALSLVAMSDSHGRSFNNATTSRTINVTTPTWTPWLNRDSPSGVGDYETLSDFLAVGQACPNPISIECKTTGGVNWWQTGEVYSCTPAYGGSCQNSNQSDGYCLDYQVRFLCP
jgi:hypothetical protein